MNGKVRDQDHWWIIELDLRIEKDILVIFFFFSKCIIFHVEEEMPLIVEQPQFLEAEVTYSEPGIKGDTATNTMKPATIDTGAEVRVPLFINTGDKIKVDVPKGVYVERVKS